MGRTDGGRARQRAVGTGLADGKWRYRGEPRFDRRDVAVLVSPQLLHRRAWLAGAGIGWKRRRPHTRPRPNVKWGGVHRGVARQRGERGALVRRKPHYRP